MRSRRPRWSSGSRRLAVLFLAVLVPSAATLVWLGIQLLEQDRRLWADRELERRERAADRIVRELGDALAAADLALTTGPVPDGVVRVTWAAGGFRVDPPASVAWVPQTPRSLEAPAQPFADAEMAEARATADRGRSVYTRLSQAPDPGVRAGASMRLARVRRMSGELEAARRTYEELARAFGPGQPVVTFGGMPVDLAARRAIGDLLETMGDRPALDHGAAELRRDLLAGQWMLDRAGWQLVADDLARWTGRPITLSPAAAAVTAALDWLWQQRRHDAGDGQGAAEGREIVAHEEDSLLVRWRRDAEALRVLVFTPAGIGRLARASLPAAAHDDDSLVLTDLTGHVVVGARAERGTRVVMRAADETGLPWALTLKPGASIEDHGELAWRQRLLGMGLGAIVLLLSGGTYLLWSTVRRELAVARLQTDFVAAVSHEFRTPLTTLQHTAELLEEEDLALAQRQSLYAALGRSTERLRGLVESLLDFARMEEGRRPYDLQTVDPSRLVHDVVSAFVRQSVATPSPIAVDTVGPGRLACRGDRAALSHALWNLLDNAVKYSAPPHDVRVSVRSQDRFVAIAVSDRGFGIAADERARVFDKFVRGRDTGRRGIPGTGLGLALVSHIVAAHGGRIGLESEEGRGSTFTILLPACAAVAAGDVADGAAANPSCLAS
jgi:two-component system phosphate regulon sensor histidine kinase PhoR